MEPLAGLTILPARHSSTPGGLGRLGHPQQGSLGQVEAPSQPSLCSTGCYYGEKGANCQPSFQRQLQGGKGQLLRLSLSAWPSPPVPCLPVFQLGLAPHRPSSKLSAQGLHLHSNSQPHPRVSWEIGARCSRWGWTDNPPHWVPWGLILVPGGRGPGWGYS